MRVGMAFSWDIIASDVFARAVDESAEPSNVELVPHFATSDGLVLQIGLALKRVLENNPQKSLQQFLDSWGSRSSLSFSLI